MNEEEAGPSYSLACAGAALHDDDRSVLHLRARTRAHNACMHGRVAAGEGDLAQKRVSNEIVVRDAPVVTVGMAQGVSHTLIHDDGAQGTRQSALRRAEPVDRGLAQCIDGICCLLELHPQGIWRELMVMARSVGGQVVGKLVACGEESGCLLLAAG